MEPSRPVDPNGRGDQGTLMEPRCLIHLDLLGQSRVAGSAGHLGLAEGYPVRI